LRKLPLSTADLEERLLLHMRQALEPFRSRPLFLAFSGGIDSVVLAAVLARSGTGFTALHFNHRWRGAASEADARWADSWCRRRKIPLLTGQAPTTGPTSENEARSQRRDFFRRVLSETKKPVLMTAHHADDRIETFFLQLLRGAGLEGLTAFRECAEGCLEDTLLLRPLFPFAKTELAAMARRWKLRWREDATNAGRAAFRNRVRLDLLPSLEKWAGRPVRAPLLRALEILAAEQECLESLPLKVTRELDLAYVRELPLALQRRLIRDWLAAHRIPNLGFSHIEAVRGLVEKARPAKINLPGARHCRRRAGRLFVT
jgi:tRNA(Ile)-lysidine synthase